MRDLPGARYRLRNLVMMSATLVVSSCGGGSSPSPGPPSSSEPPVPPGAIRVTGSERLAWHQTGDGANLRFVAYVDGNPVRLDQAQCDGATPEAACSSPLPSLSDGLHAVAVAGVTLDTQLEGERSESISLQKVSARSVVSTARLPDARVSGVGIVATLAAPDGRHWVADVVARDVSSSAQLAALPDGRVLVADGARVLSIRAGEPPALALDLRDVFGSRAGPASLAAHPEFTGNGQVFAAFVAADDPERPRLRVVRLRDVGGTLGEPATIADVPLAPADAPTHTSGARSMSTEMAVPRLAASADAFLHVLVPEGWQVGDPRLASRPVGALARLTFTGGVPEAGPVDGMTARPAGFATPATGGPLLALLPFGSDAVELRSVGGNAGSQPVSVTGVRDRTAGTMRLSAGGPLAEWTAMMMGGLAKDPVTVRLAAPLSLDGIAPGVSATLHDLVGDRAGTIYALVRDGDGAADNDSAVIVRLRPAP